jgi:hypothetical protein
MIAEQPGALLPPQRPSFDDPSRFEAIRDHRVNTVHVRAEAAQLDLLTLPRLDRERVRVEPLVRGHVRRLGRVREDVEHRRFLDDR